MVIDTGKMLTGSWKTTLFGLISAAAVFVVANPSMFARWPWLPTVAGFVATGGLAALGISGKDSGVTGGTKLESGAVPDATLHAEAKTEAAAAPPKP